MMKWLWQAPGAIVAVACMGAIMARTARLSGAGSADFWWSLLICLVVLAIALTFRYLTERPSASNGQRHKHHQPCS
jgi:hypothetical protein